MGNSHSAQHSFHHGHPHDPHHRGYPRPFHHHQHPGEIAYPPDDPRWNVHSFPRDMHRRGPPGRNPELVPENKVLPKVLGPPPKLRATNNGAILHQGGTISGRKIAQQNVAPVKAYKAKVSRGSPGGRLSANRFGGSEPDLRAPSNFRAAPAPLMMVNQQKPMVVRTNANAASAAAAAAAAAAANKKKYKAPPPPQKQESESPSDTSGWEDTGSAAPKKTRLFKTRAQTSNSPAPSSEARKSEENNKQSRAPINAAASAFLAKRSVSSPEFQQELVKAAQQKHKERLAKKHVAPEAQKVAATAQPQNKGSPTPSGPRHAPVGRESSNDHREVKENHRPTRARSPAVEQSAKKQPLVNSQPPKTFYFGMDVGGGVAAADEDEVDRFAARMRNPVLRRKRSSSGSGESYTEDEMPLNNGDINLQLRPVLPKKTPDIPRFSPTAAWRQLLVGDLPDEPEDDPRGRRRNRSISPILRETSGTAALLEERIVQCYSQRAPLLVRGSVATQEKSGDSGISGDASPGPGQNMLDSPDPAPAAPIRLRKNHSPVARQWTPEQDLDDSSSDEDPVKAARSPPSRRAVSEERPPEVLKGERGRSSGRVTPPKFTRRSHMFSLSLPRPDQLQLAANKGPEEIDSPLESPDENITTFHSLKKFKKSVSGALGSAFQNKYHSQQQLSLDENWYLSRSAPNSLDSTGEGPNWQRTPIQSDEGVCWRSPNESSSPDQYEEEEVEEIIQITGKKPLSHIASGSHIMYLPEYDSRRCIVPRVKSRNLHAGQRSLSVDVLTQLHNKEREEQGARNNNSLLIVRNNHLNERPEEMRELRPESPWEVPQVHSEDEQAVKAIRSKLTNKPGKKFTFQSTIRQIERRRVADRLSKEAEMREKQRRQEAEAMKKVEEEFQRKRAREKATLKEQLRLFSLQDSDGPQSLPAISLDERVVQRSKPVRAEPEGQAATRVAPKKSIYKQIAQSIQEDESASIRQAKSAEPREYKDYIANPAKINRYPSGERASPSPSSSSASSNTRRNVTHPAIVCDIPKTSQAYLGPIFAESDLKIVPESHNYRREFAKGAVNGGGTSAASRVPRARLSPSPSPKEQQDGGASRGHSQYNGFASLPPQQVRYLASSSSSSSGASKSTASKVPALQPFNAAKSKGYRPIGFKAPSSGASPAAGAKAKVIQAVS
ncbi:uncharacterized protein LOC132197235 isoform X2 [Neocloeon triangulifer]|uniref:uncharacterized protein LOC132197235 isoform X2 n=1 Tax=Neocloeon triangulifer TaxID=2078957 RepID=UPI00286EE257|nr:uncharacterized protein LOC132197235 isoform X2 [Neocloeon triangulifer]